MSDVTTLKSYLVTLGFQVDQPSLNHFTGIINDVSGLIDHKALNIAKNILKWQISLIGMFAAIAGAVVTAADKVAMADQEYRLFGERMFMDTEHAKSLKIALDALGQPLEAVAFDPELHARFVQLQKDQRLLAKGLGMDYAAVQKGVRDLRFEFTRLEVTAEYILQGTVTQIFKSLGLGSGSLLTTLQHVNDYIIQHAPEWSQKFATYVVPILKDTWHIAKDLVILFELLATHFTNFIGVITGDSKLQSSTFSFDRFAQAIEKVVHWVGVLLDYLIKLEQLLVPISGTLAGAAGGAGIGAAIGAFGGPIGAGAGAGIGAGVGLLYDLIAGAHGEQGAGGFGNVLPPAGNSIAEQAKALAQQVGAQINVPSDIVYSQWQHETGNFTNRGATSLNNLGGIRLPGSKEYRSFDSLQGFADYYAKQIKRNYQGAMGSKDVDGFATGLHNGRIGSYFEAPLKDYENGMKRFTPQSQSQPISMDNKITIGDIHITQPNASADEISRTILARVDDKMHKQTQRLLSEFTTVYG